MDLPLPLLFWDTMHFDYVYENMIILGSSVYIGWRRAFLEWIFHQFVAWYMNIDGELIRLLRGFDGDDDESMGEVVDP